MCIKIEGVNVWGQLPNKAKRGAQYRCKHFVHFVVGPPGTQKYWARMSV